MSSLADPLRTWVRKTLAPVASSGRPRDEPSFHIRFERLAAPASAARIEPFPMLAGGNEIYVTDSAGRAAILDLASQRPFVRCDGSLEPGTFAEWVFFPLLRSALHVADATLIHASAAEIHGRRIAIAGMSGAGKSLTLIALMRDGANFLADDCVGLSEAGTIAAVQASLSLTSFHTRQISPPHPRSLADRMQSFVDPFARDVRARTADHPALRRMFRMAGAALDSHAKPAALRTAFPNASIAEAGTLNALALLVPRGTPLPEPKHVPEILAMHAELEFAQCAMIEASFRAMFPGRLYASLFPTVAEQADFLERALHGVKIRVIEGASHSKSATAAAMKCRELLA